MKLWRSAGQIVVLTTLGSSPRLHAQQHPHTDDSRIHDIVFAADDAYRDGRYDAAVDAFEEAYRLRPQAGLLFNIGKCHEKNWVITARESSLASAVESYRRYLREVDRASPKSRHAETEMSLEHLAAALSRAGRSGSDAPAPSRPFARTTRLMVGASVPGASCSIDGGAARSLPLLEPVQPGAHHVAISLNEYLDENRDVVVVEGELFPVHAELRPAPGRLRIHAKDGAGVYVDGRFSGRTPLAQPMVLEAGMHDVALLEAGRVPWGQRIEIGRASSVEVTGELKTSRFRWISYAIMTAAATCGAYASYQTGSAFAHQQWANKFLSRRLAGETLSDGHLASYNHDVRERDVAREQAYTFGTITSLLALAAAGLYFIDKPDLGEVIYKPDSAAPRPAQGPAAKPANEHALSLTPAVDGASMGLELRARF